MGNNSSGTFVGVENEVNNNTNGFQIGVDNLFNGGGTEADTEPTTISSEPPTAKWLAPKPISKLPQLEQD
jgi:hypothetical protein